MHSTVSQREREEAARAAASEEDRWRAKLADELGLGDDDGDFRFASSWQPRQQQDWQDIEDAADRADAAGAGAGAGSGSGAGSGAGARAGAGAASAPLASGPGSMSEEQYRRHIVRELETKR